MLTGGGLPLIWAPSRASAFLFWSL